MTAQCNHLAPPQRPAERTQQLCQVHPEVIVITRQLFIRSLPVQSDLDAVPAREPEHTPLCEYDGGSERLVLMPGERVQVPEKLGWIRIHGVRVNPGLAYGSLNEFTLIVRRGACVSGERLLCRRVA